MSDQTALTDNQILRKEAREQVDRVATDLERLASRIHQHGELLTDTEIPALVIIADIVNEYTKAGGPIGPRLWGMIHGLSRMT